MGGALSHTLGLQCIDDLLPVRSKGTKPMGQQQSERDREEGSDREGEPKRDEGRKYNLGEVTRCSMVHRTDIQPQILQLFV